jgi:SSS family solute:Na+ symporter
LQGALATVAVVFVLYTLWGGQLSVIRTDAWQLLLFLGGLLASLFLVVRALVGRPEPLAELPAGFLSFPTSPGFGWYQLLVYYPLIVGMPYLAGPDIYSRVLCARDGNEARRAALSAAALVAPIALLLATLGLLLHAVYPRLTPETALPSAVMALAPAGVRGLIVVGFLGAVMSSADTTLISASTILARNVVAPLACLDQNGALRLTRRFVVAVGVVAWALAAFEQGIIASLLLAYTVFVGGVALPTLVSFAPGALGVSPRWAMAAVGLGGGTALLGAVADGVWLERCLGDQGTVLLGTLLGPESARLLPVALSALTLAGGAAWGRLRSYPPFA